VVSRLLKPHRVYVEDNVWNCLKVHADYKRVVQSRLVRDILTGWAWMYTDWEDEKFTDGSIHLEYIALPEAPYDDYWPMLGFGEPLG
jgi:hypothetical protein